VRWLQRYSPEFVRDRLSDVNDGILTVGGTSLGLAGAEIGRLTSYTVLAIAAAAGTLAVVSVQLNEQFNNYEAELDAVAHERARLAADPDGEAAELTAWFTDHGVSPETAAQVSRELSDADALRIQLALEYGIDRVSTVREAVGHALAAGAAFLIGALLPIVIQLIFPWDFRSWTAMVVTAAALTLTAIVLSPRGHYNTLLAVTRALIFGLGTLGLTYLIGDSLG